MGKHFISYSRDDGRDFALRLRDELEGGEPPFNVWVDTDLRPGEDWPPGLGDAITSCDIFLFVVTRGSVDRGPFCLKEITHALNNQKPVIPLMLHDVAAY